MKILYTVSLSTEGGLPSPPYIPIASVGYGKAVPDSVYRTRSRRDAVRKARYWFHNLNRQHTHNPLGGTDDENGRFIQHSFPTYRVSGDWFAPEGAAFPLCARFSAKDGAVTRTVRIERDALPWDEFNHLASTGQIDCWETR